MLSYAISVKTQDEEYKMNMPIRENQQGFQSLINQPSHTLAAMNLAPLWKNVESLVEAKSELINTVSMFDAQAVIDAISARWSSLYDDASVVEGGVEGNDKAYLDEYFPLASGSHKQVKSYVVYYHHLLAFFEDGTQSGLDNPKQFVALCGHKCSPNSIVLKQSDLHTELVFNKQGKRGVNDMAGIDDIRIENGITTLITFDKSLDKQPSSADAYANLIALLSGQLTAGNGNTPCAGEISFTDVDGEDYMLSTRTPIVIQGAGDIKAVFA